LPGINLISQERLRLFAHSLLPNSYFMASQIC
jgi:hypothetical protein